MVRKGWAACLHQRSTVMSNSPSENRVAAEAISRRFRFGQWGQSEAGALSRAEWAAALLLTCVCVGLHVVRLFRAGPLWRDEAAVVGLANLPSVKEVFAQFPHEAFPMLFPLTVRVVTRLGGNTDLGFRVFGFLVGVGILAAMWFSLRLCRRGVPLLSLALVGLNASILQWGDSLRGYGMGALFIVLLVGLIWRMTERGRQWSFWAALAVSLAAVQCLFHNPPLLLALCVAGMAVTLRYRDRKQTFLVLLVGLVAAVSLLPYRGPLQDARRWDEVVRLTVHPAGDLWLGLADTLAASGWSNIWVWAGLFVLAEAICWRQQKLLPTGIRSRDLLLFCGVALLLAFGGCLGFLNLLGYVPRAWYFLALIVVCGVLFDAVFDTLEQRWARAGRLALVGVVVLTSFPSAWRAATTRQSNLDVVAAKLRLISAHDMIVVRPWPMGISFARYYAGSTPWLTVPPIEFHKFHRYDLVQAQMELPDPERALLPLFERVRTTLKSGHNVWFVGQLSWSSGPSDVQNEENIASLKWSRQLGSFLRASARHLESVPIACEPPVNGFENLPVWKLEGWSGKD